MDILFRHSCRQNILVFFGMFFIMCALTTTSCCRDEIRDDLPACGALLEKQMDILAGNMDEAKEKRVLNQIRNILASVNSNNNIAYSIIGFKTTKSGEHERTSANNFYAADYYKIVFLADKKCIPVNGRLKLIRNSNIAILLGE